MKQHTLKIINDPVYGFISIHDDIILNLIEHPYFQRLRRINQLGLTQLVYPGALHTRFHHALGAYHLTQKAITTLIQKGVEISESEKLSTLIAILLHDIGHGPYSHALEHQIIDKVNHEELSIAIIKQLNTEFDGQLSLALDIFENKYHKYFLHQLISSQLDMDRLDYLTRDSFYTGVSEGIVGFDRIISMLNVYDDNLVVEEKGIYSIEKFIIARRIMYWQVYLHKTVLAADDLLIQIFRRIKYLIKEKQDIDASPVLIKLISESNHHIETSDFISQYCLLDDSDVLYSIKKLCLHKDFVLNTLCNNLINRKLPKLDLQKNPIHDNILQEKIHHFKLKYQLDDEALSYFINIGQIKNEAYKINSSDIKIWKKNGNVLDFTEASDIDNIAYWSDIVIKYYITYPRT